MAGAVQKDAMTVESIFEDLKGRRAGLIKALTTDVREFYQQCDPEEEPLCLFGLPSGRWEVKPLANDGFPLLPDPALGINKARDTMQEQNWLSLVALRSDGWLLAVAFFIGNKFGKANWRRLFLMINALPTIYEIVTGEANKRAMEKSSVPYHSGNNSKFGSEAGSEPQGYCSKPMQARDGENHGLEEEEEGNEELTSGPAVISVLSGSMGSVSMSPNKNGV